MMTAFARIVMFSDVSPAELEIKTSVRNVKTGSWKEQTENVNVRKKGRR